MKPFAYGRPASARDAAVTVARDSQAAFIAGGTNLVDLMKLEVASPSQLVDVTRVVPVGIVRTATGGVTIGAGTRNSDVAADPLIRDRWPVLAQAVLAGASVQIRNVATVGGNLLQRTRCPYFTHRGSPCNKRVPGSGCSVRDGAHRNNAILGASASCVATHPSDMAVALAALDATVETLARDGTRTVPLVDLHRLPGGDPSRDTTLRHGELITSVQLPALPDATRTVYRKVRDRGSFAFALVSACVVLRVAEGSVQHVAIALGGVAHRPWRAMRAEELLQGRPAVSEVFEAAVAAELAAATPLEADRFKVNLTQRLVVRLLSELSEPAR